MLVNNKRWIGGHHPNWTPDNNVIMNLMYENPKAYLGALTHFLERAFRKFGIRFFSNHKYLRVAIINTETGRDYPYNSLVFGSGHPSMHPSGKFSITDAYPNERVSFGDGSVPIRIITPKKEKILFTLDTKPKHSGKSDEWRIDPHPAFSFCGNYVVTNFLNGEKRGVRIDNLGLSQNEG
jgi:hypothetical protein